LTIELYKGEKAAGSPKISAIEVKLVGPHYAHAVANGPYKAVDMSGEGIGYARVDGSKSHTHRPGAKLNRFLWKLGSKTLAQGDEATLKLPVGVFEVTLQVFDDMGSESSESTTITILPFGYPAVASIEPASGSIKGGDIITIIGSGFIADNPNDIVVHFGLNALRGDDIQIVNASTIIVLSSPPTLLGIPVAVSIETPKETSNGLPFTYISGSSIKFEQGILTPMTAPTVARFGPDRKLYIGTLGGVLTKYTLDETYTNVISFVASTVTLFRAILGIAFDPMEVNTDNPSVYISNSYFFHNEWKSTSGNAVNGKISVVRGANLDIVGKILMHIFYPSLNVRKGKHVFLIKLVHLHRRG
jgi:IPT/TIG domain